jgi:hypothetical protein
MAALEGAGEIDGATERKLRALALGIERIGLLSLRFPVAATIVLVLLAVGAAFGVTRLKVDDSLSQLFRSDSAEFRHYEALVRRFPSAEYDVLIVVEGERLMARENLERLRDFVTEIQLIDGTRGLVSLFSARQAPTPGALIPPPLFPEPLPEGPAYEALVQRVLANEIIGGRLLSPDGRLALVVLALEPDIAGGARLREVIAELRQQMSQSFEGSGVSAQLSGVPVMQYEIRTAVERDRLVYNALGFAAGCAIAILFFRRVSFMIVAAGPPLIAILLSLGLLGWLDFRLNMFLNVMTPLIMVISFADSMQLTYAARARLMQGETSRVEAMRKALIVVGPACVLTHATAALSFAALLFSQSELIRTFGQAGLIASVVALVAVLMLCPLLGVLLLRGEAKFAAQVSRSDPAVNLLVRFCRWIAERMVDRAGFYSVLSVLVVGGLCAIYATLEPRYRLADQVPDRRQAVAASGRIDAKLAGSNPIDVLIELPAGASLYDPRTLSAISAVHATVESQRGVANVLSPETLRRWIAQRDGAAEVDLLRRYVDVLPAHLTRRFVSERQDAVLVTGRVPDIDASELLPVVQGLEERLGAVRAAHPGYGISVTGLSVVAARNSADMIGKLNQALTVEIVFVAAFLGLAFRSFVVALLCILPGLFPVVMSGTLLWAIGEGLQFASIVALIVSFGLGLSATIHFLNRMRLEERPGEDPAEAITRATVLVGPALILTSIVLACGLAMTALSDLPSLRVFGWLSAFSMLAALVADLLILRPTAIVLFRWSRRGGPP